MHRRLQADLAVADAYVPEAPPTPVEFTDISESVALAQTVQKIDARYSTTNNVAGNQYHVINYINNEVQNASQSPSNISPSQPVPPEIFYGRDEIVDKLVEVLDRPGRVRIAILGTGGIGKTSLALHLINRDKIISRFDERRHFLACDSITSAETLATLLLSVLGTSPASSENPTTTLQRVLNTLPPTLLVLDNFETPWDPEASRSSVEDLLAVIGSGRNTSLIITMRGSVPPSMIIWNYTEVIVPLSPEAARQTYFAINPSGNDIDESALATLDALLRELDWVPLAIRLLATIGRGFAPAYLMRQWREEKTSLLYIRNHRLDSIAVSISLSLSQLSITENPDSVQLLGVLCLLPDGLHNWIERISQIGRGLNRVQHLARVLLQTSLCFIQGDTMKVLSLIRHYVITNHPADAHYISDLENFYWSLIRDYAATEPGPKFANARKALDPEMGNIRHLLRNAIRDHPSPNVVQVTLNLSEYFYNTVASTELLNEVKGYMQSLGDTLTEARWSQALGKNLRIQNRHEEATSMLTAARKKFIEIDSVLGAAQCSQILGDVLAMQNHYGDANSVLVEAREKFIEIGDVLGAARCSRSLGIILRLQSRYGDASSVLMEAREKFIEIGDLLGAAQCSHSLGEILRMQSRHGDASSVLMEAREKFIEIGYVLGTVQCSRSLGNILRTQSRYREATSVLMEAREQFIEIGSVLGAAQCSRSIGQILSSQKQYTEASNILSGAREQFSQVGDRLEEAHCLKDLGETRMLETRYPEATEFLKQARIQYLDIGDQVWVEDCDRILKDIAVVSADESQIVEDRNRSLETLAFHSYHGFTIRNS